MKVGNYTSRGMVMSVAFIVIAFSLPVTGERGCVRNGAGREMTDRAAYSLENLPPAPSFARYEAIQVQATTWIASLRSQ